MTSADECGAPWDPGLQNERTALAWQRSVLATAAVGLIIARLAFPGNPVLSVVLAGVTVGFASWALVMSTRRYRAASRRLSQELPLPDGKLVVATCLLITLMGLASLALVITGSF